MRRIKIVSKGEYVELIGVEAEIEADEPTMTRFAPQPTG
jgi:hypothetical protein